MFDGTGLEDENNSRFIEIYNNRDRTNIKANVNKLIFFSVTYVELREHDLLKVMYPEIFRNSLVIQYLH